MSKPVVSERKNLIKRYLLWCYKTTKEELDHIDRKFTQLKVDNLIWRELLKTKNNTLLTPKDREGYRQLLNDFKAYIEKKESEAPQLKFSEPKRQTLSPQYLYLANRLRGIEKAIQSFLGPAEVKKIKRFYEDEMIRRILQVREHT
jgi:hypothetical protein